MLMDTFADAANELNKSVRGIFDKCLDEMANKMMKSMDVDGSEVLEWPEFKNYMMEFTKQQADIMDIIRTAKASTY